MAFLSLLVVALAATADIIEQLGLDCTALIAFVTASLSSGNHRTHLSSQWQELQQLALEYGVRMLDEASLMLHFAHLAVDCLIWNQWLIF